jgi:uncharacterized protein (DUF58 family)
MARSRPAFPVPTVWFAALAAATGLALFAWPGRSWSALWAVEALLGLLLVGDAVACVSPRRIAVQREMPETITLGERGEVTWLVDNTARRRAKVTVTDALWPSLQAERRRVSARLRGGARLRARAALQPTRRGRFPLADVTVRVEGPLRMVSRQATRRLPGGLRVLPAYPSRDEVLRRMRMPRVLEVGMRSIRTSGGGREFDQLRDYRPDDEFRRIDWPATVRLQRPIVKQYRAERNQTVVVMLDNGRVMAGVVGGSVAGSVVGGAVVEGAVGVPRVEHAMDAALGLVHAATALGDRVGMVAFDRQVRSILAPSNAKSQLGRAAEAMFALDPDLSESAYHDAFHQATARFRRRSLFVVLTDLVEAAVEQAILPALPILTRRHLVVVAAVHDPVLQQWAAGDEAEWEGEVFREAAAVNHLHQRRRAVARLRAAGAIVIDAAPGRLAVELVDSYLAVKASGRL